MGAPVPFGYTASTGAGIKYRQSGPRGRTQRFIPNGPGRQL